MATTYRSVKVIFQNNTNQTLTVHGCAVLRGIWTKDLEAKQGADIQKQSVAVWGSESQEIVAGTSAFVRVGSVHGYVKVSWSLPWVGAFDFSVQPEETLTDILRVLPYEVDDRRPDAVVVSVTLEEVPRPESPPAG
ncbi:hypothetical protein WME99_21115 [Sorangium sp. So ce136]|uniref:hypothetical protein n=1 Tax=Sorangium sp. So ce136 TaxID=3133284 RepID=UPI003EFE24B6